MARSSNIVSRIVGTHNISPTTRVTLREAVHEDGSLFLDARIDFLTDSDEWKPTAKGFHIRLAHFLSFLNEVCLPYSKEPRP